MEVRKESFNDRSEPDASGVYEFIYVGAVYTFAEGDERLAFRVYDDEPQKAALVEPITWRPDIYASDLFRKATDHLRDHVGVRRFVVVDPSPVGRGFISFAEAIVAAQSIGLGAPHLQDPDAAT